MKIVLSDAELKQAVFEYLQKRSQRTLVLSHCCILKDQVIVVVFEEKK